MKTPTCHYHCRSCGGHFTSLRAFDSHRSGPWSDRRCSYPDDSGLVEIEGGVCYLSDADEQTGAPIPQMGVTLYEHQAAADVREYFEAAA
jgi:hypothetical protein